MAINFDTYTQADSGAPVASPYTFSTQHTASGTNRIVILFGISQANNDLTVTYGGQSMTSITAFQGIMSSDLVGEYNRIFYLINPPTGAQNIIFTWTGGNTYVGYRVASYTGAKQTGQPDANATNEGASVSSLTSNLTTVADNCWTVLCSRSRAASSSAGSGTTLRSTAQSYSFADSNGAITPAGSTSLALNYASATNMTQVIVSIAPAVDTFIPRIIMS